jgi:hypothetical protein
VLLRRTKSAKQVESQSLTVTVTVQSQLSHTQTHNPYEKLSQSVTVKWTQSLPMIQKLILTQENSKITTSQKTALLASDPSNVPQQAARDFFGDGE